MNQQTAPSRPFSTGPGGAGPGDRAVGPALKAVRAVAVLACLPYVSLKVAWIAGSRIGIPEGSALLDHRAVMAVANGVTVLMDAAVVVLALLLTQRWGLRVRAWLLVLPAWVATGLLAPIMAGFPLQLLVRLFGGSVATSDAGPEPFLDEWVFGVVYGGFMVQGLALGVLFVACARHRWGHLWQGTVQEVPTGAATGPAQRTVATAAALLTLLPVVLRVLWACGATVGLPASYVAERTADSSALEWTHALFAVATAVGVLMLAFRRGGALPLRVPLALAWVGSGALACWGGWMSLASLTGVADVTNRPTALMHLTYAVQMIVGTLVLTLGAYFFAERAAERSAARRAG